MKKRKTNYTHLFIAILVPVLCIFLLGFGVYKMMQPKKEQPKKKTETVQETFTPTLESLLKHAIEPMGSTMYIWGGGWNEEDTGAGIEARTIGVSSTWKEFYDQQDASYDYSLYDYQIHNGLDCSGYIGWIVYNTMYNENDKDGFVTESGNMPSYFEELGYGTHVRSSEIVDYKPGDIMANDGHVYLVLCQYDDGSLLIAHSSPPGVRLCGTPQTNGDTNSQALQAAQTLMQEHFSDWYNKYPNCSVDYSYLTDYDQFRWNDTTFQDANTIQNMTSDEIVDLLFN